MAAASYHGFLRLNGKYQPVHVKIARGTGFTT
jgi:hypothetical protein